MVLWYFGTVGLWDYGLRLIADDGQVKTFDDVDVAVGTTGTPEMAISGNAVEITGTANLTLTGSPLVSISGSGSAAFSVTTDPSTPLTAGNDTTFVVRFAPSTSRTWRHQLNPAVDTACTKADGAQYVQPICKVVQG